MKKSNGRFDKMEFTGISMVALALQLGKSFLEMAIIDEPESLKLYNAIIHKRDDTDHDGDQKDYDEMMISLCMDFSDRIGTLSDRICRR